MNEEQTRTAFLTLYLASCLLNGLLPDSEKVHTAVLFLKNENNPESITDLYSDNLRLLYNFCDFHSLTALICSALESADAFAEADPDIIHLWKEAKNKSIRKTILIDAERKKIEKYMDQCEIWHVPLKGSILKDLYPGFGLRQMADVDILIDNAYRKQIRDYMEERGYSVEKYKITKHDVYYKPPVYNMEIHMDLFDIRQNSEWTNYYRNVKDRLLPDTDNSFGYHFKPEDFYIHIVLHAYMHFFEGGTGLRTLTDEYVFLNEYEKHLDHNYIRQELTKLDILEFEQKLRRLSEHILKNPNLSPELSPTETAFLNEFIRSGTHGLTQFRIMHQIENLQGKGSAPDAQGRLHWYLFRFFPNREWCRYRFPLVYQYPVLLPFLYVYRLFSIPFVSRTRRRVLSELKGIRKLRRNEK